MGGFRRLLRRLTESDETRLESEIQAGVDAYVDPWQEAEQAVHPAQFAGLLTAAAGTRIPHDSFTGPGSPSPS